jgi:hypothetical protein
MVWESVSCNKQLEGAAVQRGRRNQEAAGDDTAGCERLSGFCADL